MTTKRGKAKNYMSEKTLTQHLHDLLDHTIYLGKTIFSDTSVTPIEITKICCTPLLIKAMYKAHAINLLVSEGLLEESEIILRVLIEISFIIGAIEKNPEFSLKYGRSAYAQRLRTLKNVQSGINQNIPNLEVPDTFRKNLERDIVSLREKTKGDKIKEIKIIDYAKEARLLSIYYTSYSALCSSIHSGPEDLESYFSKVHDGSVLKISPPDKNNEEVILFTATEAMLRILKALSSLFSVESEKLREAEEAYKGVNTLLWKKLNPNEYFGT
jgi:hypothetical protein